MISILARTVALVAALSSAVPVAAEALEGPRSFEAEYAFTLLGFNIGKSTFRSTISGDTFSLNGTVASSGIARIIDQTKGTTSVTGRFGRSGTPRPDAYMLAFTSGKTAKRTEIAFANGDVTSTQKVPAPKPRPANWKPLGKRDLVAVADPISSTLVKAPSLRAVCDRTLKIYDGELRADLKLNFAGIKPVKAEGFEGEAAVCKGTLVPVSGYKEGDKSVEVLRKGGITIHFAPMGDTGVYAPIHLTAPTEIGTLTVSARRFATLD